MVWGDSSLLSALCTGPCGVEIGAALPKVAVSEETAEMQSTQGHAAGMHLPFLVPWGDLLALTVYCVALQVVFMALSSKEELDIVMMIPFLPNPHSAPSFSGMHAPCKWSRGLLPCVFLPGLVPSLSLTFPGACTHFRTEVLSFFFFFLALIPEQLVAVSFSEKSKMCLCTGRKKIFCTSPAEEMAQKIQSGSVQLWEPLENDGTMSALGDALHVPGGVGDTGV